MDDPPASFRDAWLKWGWASAHAEVLKSEVQAALNEIEKEEGITVTAASRYDAKRHCIIVTTETVPAIPERLGLIFGDVVQGLRNALDHLAWELVQRGRTPNLTEKQERRICFPIALERDFFNASLRDALPGVRRTEIAKLRRYQPYQAGKRMLNRHPLTVLAKFSNDDKHRTIQPVLVLPIGWRYEIADFRDCVVTRIRARGNLQRLEVGAEITRIYVRRTGPEPNVEMKGRVAVQPIVGDLVVLQDWLEKVTLLTGAILREFAEAPKDLIDAVAPLGREHVFP